MVSGLALGRISLPSCSCCLACLSDRPGPRPFLVAFCCEPMSAKKEYSESEAVAGHSRTRQIKVQHHFLAEGFLCAQGALVSGDSLHNKGFGLCKESILVGENGRNSQKNVIGCRCENSKALFSKVGQSLAAGKILTKASLASCATSQSSGRQSSPSQGIVHFNS